MKAWLLIALLAVCSLTAWAQAPSADEVASFRKYAEQGDAFAQYNLGVKYDNGQGVPQDYPEGRQVAAPVKPGGLASHLPPLGGVHLWRRASDQ